jgi:hypothetical protein
MVARSGSFRFYYKVPFSVHIAEALKVLPDGSENRVLWVSLRSEVLGGFSTDVYLSTILLHAIRASPLVWGLRRVRGLFSNNSRSSWAAVDLGRPSSGEMVTVLVLRGDKIGESSVGERGERSALRDAEMGVGIFSRLEEPSAVPNPFVARSCEESGGLSGGDNNPGRRWSIGEALDLLLSSRLVVRKTSDLRLEPPGV